MKAANVLLIKPTISNYEGNMVTQILFHNHPESILYYSLRWTKPFSLEVKSGSE